MPPRKRSWRSPDGTTNTVWMADFTFKYPDGTTLRVRERSPVNTKEGAREFERLRRAALLAGPATPAKVIPTLSAFAETFLTEAKNNNKASSVHSKDYILRKHLKPAFGRLTLDKIDAEAIENFKAEKLAGGLKAKTINNLLIALGRLLTLAVERRVLESRPKIKHLKLPPQSFVYLDFEETERFFAATPTEWKAMVTVAIKTGLRIGELIELKWEDIDLVAQRVIVRRNIWRGVVDTTKGGRTREVPLSGSAVAALKNHRHLKGPYVFCQADGQQFSYDLDSIQNILPFISKKAGIAKHITWHATRHTFASHLVMRGVPLLAVKEYLGHTDIKTTQIYAHLAPAARNEWVNALDGASVTLGAAPERADSQRQGTGLK